jgi:dCMP deaminase
MTEAHKRPSWDEYFMNIARVVATRATCDRGRSGCVIVMGHHILTTGYVGSPPSIANCDEVGHEMSEVVNPDGTVSKHCIRSTHAEQNAIIQAARNGVELKGATLYCKMTPCYTCAKLIITAGITKVIAEKDYHAGGRTKDVFKEAGVELVILGEVEQYSNQ